MELIHIANATFSSSRIKSNQLISLENLASKTKLTGLLKSTRCALRRRAIRRVRPRGRARVIVRVRDSGRRCGRVVEPAGIEPATFWLQTRRSPS